MKKVEDFIDMPAQVIGTDFDNRQPNEREIRYREYSQKLLKRKGICGDEE